MTIAPTAPCWVSASADGTRVFSRLIGPGQRETIRGARVLALDIGDAGAFAYTINGERGRTLGRSGQVVSARITPANLQSYLASR
jgi:hypothetical protein